MSTEHSIGTPFIELPTIDSTNNYAMGMVHEGMAHHGLAVFTHDQTKGKGQWSRQWVSQKDQNIALTIIFEPKHLQVNELFLLSMTIATAACAFVDSYTNGDVSIKWPNDIYWRDRKAGGILIENVIKGNQWKYALAGIGLNINQVDFQDLQHKAVSFRQITGRPHSPLQLAKELCSFVEQQWQKFVQDPEIIATEYRERLYKKNQKVKLKKGSQLFEATIMDVLPTGELVVQHAFEERLKVGEVEWNIDR